MFSCWLASHLAAERQSLIGKLIGHLAARGMHVELSICPGCIRRTFSQVKLLWHKRHYVLCEASSI